MKNPHSSAGSSSSQAASLTELIGNTPLLRLRRLTAHLPDAIEVYVKAEWFNPGGSVKDRAAYGIVSDALERGVLKSGGILLDASSGNTGIAYAMLAAALGFKLELCIPKNANHERKRTLRAYGAELIFTDPNDGSDGAIVEARRRVAENPERYYYADQYNNDANWRAHYKTTGPEIHRQTQGRVTHVVSGLGTSGTAMGLARYLREHLPAAQLVAFQPDSPFHGLEGMKHMETAIVPGIYDDSLPHQNREVVTEAAHAMARRLGRREGLLVGVSAAAAISLAIQLADEEAEAGRAAVIVAMGCDGGDRYLSDHFWDDEE